MTVLDHGRECFLFDRGRAEFNAAENRGVENVKTSVDAVANEFNWLLNEAINAAGVARLVNNHTIFRGLFNLCDYNCALFAVCLVEFNELFEWIFADDVGVEDEERAIVLAENLLR